MRSRILVGLLAGTIGGFIGWLLQENLVHYQVVRDALTNGCRVVDLTIPQTRTLIYCVGGLIGLFLGAVDGIVETNPRKLATGMGLGLICGILLGYVGFYFGNVIYNSLGGSSESSAGILAFGRQVIARAFGWAMMGLGLGVGSALSTRTPKRIAHGALGGFLGGFIGGFIFDLLGQTAQPISQALGNNGGCQEGGGPSRAVGFTAIGGLSGFFIGIVEELLKQAWVKVLAGRNEGKEFIFSKPVNILGRDERCDVPLFGDMSVGVQHAAIRADKNRHYLVDAGTPAGTIVNGQRLAPSSELLLRDGDMIQIGVHRILFHEKATQSKVTRPAVDTPGARPNAPASSVPMPSHLCPFCGSAKDAAGNCRCSVAGAPPSPMGGGTMPPAAGYGGPPMQAGSPGTYYGASSAPLPGGMGAAPRGGSEMPRIVGIEGPYTGEVFLLTGQNISIGREPGRDIVLSADTSISRSHAQITNEGGDLVVYDNGSSNGTLVNGMRVTMQVLVPGDIVQFGYSKFRYE